MGLIPPFSHRVLRILGLDSFVYRVLRWGITREVMKLEVEGSGLAKDGVPFVRLNNGRVFYGHMPNRKERSLYRSMDRAFRAEIREEAFRVALEIVTMYVYPHAMPALTPPYPRLLRYGFHPQHKNTIRDLDLPAAKKQELLDHFRVSPGEVILDVGSHIGYGTIRLAEAVGAQGLAVAVEADPLAVALLVRNVEANDMGNIFPVQKAAYKEATKLTFYRRGRQANSLLKSVVRADAAVSVDTDTVDHILAEHDMPLPDMVSLTINGAEYDALLGMNDLLSSGKSLRINLAGWYRRGGQPVHSLASPFLRQKGFSVAVGPNEGVLAWR